MIGWKGWGFLFGVVLMLTSSAHAADDALPEWEAAYLRGEYAKVIQSVAQHTERDSAAGRRDYLWYLVGMSHLQIQQFPEAHDAFRRVVTEHPNSEWKPAAEVGLADTLWLSGDPAGAVSQYQEILFRYGANHPIALRASYQLGGAARAAGQWETARTALRGVSDHFPASFEARQARQILSGSDFAFSVQVGAFGLKSNATRLQQQLSRMGYSASVDQASADGRAMHRVRVGKFQNRDEATRVAQDLKKEGFPAKVVP